MSDISGTVKAKSDQLNAVDLLGGGVAVTIKSVVVNMREKQSLIIELEEDYQTFKPCLTVRRQILKIWGKESDDFVGRQLVLYCEPTVKWGGNEEGGIRISHASNMKGPADIRLRESQHKTAVWRINPIELFFKANEVIAVKEKKETKQEPIVSIEQAAILMQLATVDNNGVTEWTPTAGDVMTENKIPNIDQLPASKFELVKKQLEANNV